jgi:hypothetical protein
MKQTAVEWLIKEYSKYVDDSNVPFKVIEQAKAMQKQQIMDACNAGLSGIPRSSEKYYNETHGGKDEL